MTEYYQDKLQYLKEQFEIGNYGRVEKTAQELIASNHPDLIKEGLFHLGQAASFQFKDDEAKNIFTRLINQFPKFELGYLGRYDLYLKIGEFTNARKDAYTLYTTDRTNPEYVNSLITVDEYLKDYESVIDLCDEVLNLYPGEYNFLCVKANALLALKQFQNALDHFLEAHQTKDLDDIEKGMGYNNIGLCYSKMGMFEEAKTNLELALQYDDDPFAYNNLGYVLAELGHLAKGFEYINKSLALDPQNSYAYKNRAKLFLMEGKRKAAITDLEMARDLDYELYYDNEVNDLLEQLTTDS